MIFHRINAYLLKKLPNSCNFYSKYHTLKPPWSILFFGTDAFSLDSLKILSNELNSNSRLIKRLEVVTVIREKKPNEIEKYSRDNKLRLCNWPISLNKNDFDIGIVVSFGKLIPSNIIDSFPLGMLNVHASLLPRWRGAAPIIYAIANGDETTGVTVMRIKPKRFDVGDILLKTQVPISPDMKMPQLYSKLAAVGSETLHSAVKQLPDLLNQGQRQNEQDVTLAPRINSSFARVQWNEMSSEKIVNLERALYSLYPLTTSWNGISLKLFDFCVCSEEDKVGAPGFVCFDKERNLLRIKCADESFVFVKNVLVLGKKLMNASEFNNGYIKKMPLDKRLFK